MATVTKTDVIIVGAGPTGLSLAVQLIRYGIDFQIFDKKEGVTDLSKALGVHARTLEIYVKLVLASIFRSLAGSSVRFRFSSFLNKAKTSVC
jgi:2-polyprenyl-6-methoxyphenol hydroxylase-like FAD-dependent oxidoreductase